MEPNPTAEASPATDVNRLQLGANNKTGHSPKRGVAYRGSAAAGRILSLAFYMT